MSDRERIEQYINSIAHDFDPAKDQLTDLLDSVSLLQLIIFIEQEFDVSLDLSSLALDDFRNVESVLQTIEIHRGAR